MIYREVIKQGEPGTSFFVIAQGELEVFIKDAQGEEKRVRDLSWMSGTHSGDGKRWKEMVGLKLHEQFQQPFGEVLKT